MMARRLARWLLGRLAPREVRAAFLDDLDEAFEADAGRRQPWRRGFWYAHQAMAGAPFLLKMRLRQATQAPQRKEPRMSQIDAVGRDIRHAVRQLRRAPGFTLAAVITLALGIGANAAIFGVVKSVILRPLPYADVERVVMVWNAADRGGITHLSLREFVSYGENTRSLEDLAAYTETNANMTGDGDPERVRAAFATVTVFDTLGVRAQHGRTFVTADGAPGADAIVVLGQELWQRRFGGAADVVGRTIRVNGRPRTVIGVMPASFRLPLDYRAGRPTEVWLPLPIDPANLGGWGDRSYFVVGRLRAGVVPPTATSEFRVISERWIRAGFLADQGDGRLARSAIPVQELITGEMRRPLLILLGAVGVVLFIACANVVNLLLARADGRRRELAIRAALGATQRRIVRQLLTESLVLSACGGLSGLGLAHAGTRVLTAISWKSVPRLDEAAIDAGVLILTLGVSIGAGLLFGLAPALQLSRPDLSRVLRDGGGAGRGRGLTFRRGLVIVQLASSVVLVIGAGLLVRSLVQLYRVDLGFNPRNVLTAQIQLPQADYPQSSDVVLFYRGLIERLEDLPGVRAAGAVRVLPLSRNIGNWSITIEGRPYSREENPNADFQWATPHYSEAMETTLLAGRFLTADDREDSPLVAVINDTMAARYWRNEEAIGKRFHMGGGGDMPKLTIVGIVRTARHNRVAEPPRAEMYLPHAQLPRSVGSAARAMALVIKTAADPSGMVTPVRHLVLKMDRNLPLADVRPMDQVVAAALSGPRFATLLLGLFAALALTLAAIGIYGTNSLLVAERAHEIGIRMALGAERRAILTLILNQGLVLTGGGIALGLAGAFGLTRLLSSLVYDVSTVDPLTYCSVPVLLGGVALIACLLPARRAAAVDPVVTLRRG